MNVLASVMRLIDPALLELLEVLPTATLSDATLSEWRNVSLPAYELGAAHSLNNLNVRTELVDVSCARHRVPLRIYQPSEIKAPLGCIYHIHGGGFVSGNALEWDAQHRNLCMTLGCVLVSVDYRLAPEIQFPGNIEDCYAGLEWVFRNAPQLRIDTGRLGLMGESAGGGLAAALALLARDRGTLNIAFQHLTYPMLDDRTCTAVPNPFTGFCVWTRQNNHFGWSALLGQEPGSEGVSAYAAPARAATLKGLPPTYLSTATLDLFVDENVAYAQRLMHVGVPVELHVYPRAFHGFDWHPTAAVSIAARMHSRAALARFVLERP
jgi:triacylglycerol lipase